MPDGLNGISGILGKTETRFDISELGDLLMYGMLSLSPHCFHSLSNTPWCNVRACDGMRSYGGAELVRLPLLNLGPEVMGSEGSISRLGPRATAVLETVDTPATRLSSMAPMTGQGRYVSLHPDYDGASCVTLPSFAEIGSGPRVLETARTIWVFDPPEPHGALPIRRRRPKSGYCARH